MMIFERSACTSSRAHVKMLEIGKVTFLLLGGAVLLTLNVLNVVFSVHGSPPSFNCGHSKDLQSGVMKITFCDDNLVDIRRFMHKTPTTEGINLKKAVWENLLTLFCNKSTLWSNDRPFICSQPLILSENINVTDCGRVIDIRMNAGSNKTIVGSILRQDEWKYLLNTYCK